MRDLQLRLLVALLAAAPIACTNEDGPSDPVKDASGSSSDAPSATDGGAGPDAPAAAGTVGLTAADKDGIAPCPNQAIFGDAAQLDALKAALRDGMVTYLDIPYKEPTVDPDIFKKKCGLEGFWEPSKYTDSIPSVGAPTLATALTNGHSGICSQGFLTFGVDEGFPVAGVYRKELKAAHMGATYHLRVRVTAAGAAAGQKFSANAISVPNDIRNTLVYKVNGTAAAHDALWGELVKAFPMSSASQLPAVDLTTEKGGQVLFTSKIELLCASKM